MIGGRIVGPDAVDLEAKCGAYVWKDGHVYLGYNTWWCVIRRPLVTPAAIREMIGAINEHGRLQAENQAPELQRVQRQIASLEKQDANLRHALRIAKPNAAERIALEVDEVAAEIRQAAARRRSSSRSGSPCRCRSGSSSRRWTRWRG